MHRRERSKNSIGALVASTGRSKLFLTSNFKSYVNCAPIYGTAVEWKIRMEIEELDEGKGPEGSTRGEQRRRAAAERKNAEHVL